ncbi:MAG: hypothetical protein US50_C0065G0009 [Candidatus Nomurabacteria bacterium GW2011_GWB1_37_5]|uniref:Major facilitator superfamily (MFS) profile domain-containing protein n=1 Tax=Candidatus Nomurabacteria bacterium GW2011_GWB1_37_5 TaxID=1618742 RepID=A0A0G0GSF3_9BACT|nr:MAG: hypothetical protein US50_C0065G0009 [Candidatus Nomurabacteria bacterium GW2011_GWB1_37_5]
MFRYKIPKGIKLLTWATTIRWVGWGFFEAILPVFIFSFTASFAETGVLKSVYYVVFLVAAPLAGMLTDKVSSKVIVLIGLAMYPFISLSYFFAGATGMALFIVIARALNGFGYAFDAVGRATYFRQNVPEDKIATTFGYFDVITTLFWILAVLSSLYLIKIFEVHELALIILPTSLVAMAIVFFIKDGGHENLRDGFKHALAGGFLKNVLLEVKGWGRGMRLIALINFFIGFVAVMSDFIIPIRVYQESGSLPKVILIGVILALPGLFDFRLGKFADKHRIGSLFIGLSSLLILFASLAFTDGFIGQMIIAFLLGISFNLINLASDGLTTKMVQPEHFGRMSSLNFDIDTVGTILGPIAIGLMIDSFSFSSASLVLAFFSLIILILMLAKKKDLIK